MTTDLEVYDRGDIDPYVTPSAMFGIHGGDLLNDLFDAYSQDLRDMFEISSIFNKRYTEAISHFLAANGDHRSTVCPEKLFQLGPAVGSLNATYWDRALKLTDVLESMPQKRRDEWWDLIREHKTPTFDRDTVTATLGDLLSRRYRFFAERVDGIFQSLSSEHLTNRPEGFGKRMIVRYVVTDGYVNVRRGGVLNDLRCVVARFMGRSDGPMCWQTYRIVDHAYRIFRGQWVDLDGGSVRIRVYGNGNAHLEVHPDIAWRLNAVLASLYPTAIPHEHRRRPSPRTRRDAALLSNPLPFEVLNALTNGRFSGDGRVYTLGYGDSDRLVEERVGDVLMSLGAMRLSNGSYRFEFDAREVVAAVITSGSIPDAKAHQYYPTPEWLAKKLVEAAEITGEETILEPSAGQGAISDFLSRGKINLVEVSPLFCEVLRAKGYSPVCADFLTWKPVTTWWDRVIMNPPYDRGRWRAHLERAMELTKPGGLVAALLPEGAQGAFKPPSGWSVTWGEVVPFPGTSIRVVMAIIRKHNF